MRKRVPTVEERVARQTKRIEARMAAGMSGHDATWPPRGIHAFSRSGGWTTKHTATEVSYICTVCDKTIKTFDRSIHAFTRSAQGKAAVRAHTLKEHSAP